MSQEIRELLGPVGQIGYVVQDLDAAVASWHATTGIGPWRVMDHIALDHFTYQGVETPIDMSIALAFSGGVQIELIEQHDDSPSMYHELLETYGEGVQHVCFYPDDYDAALAAAEKQGMTAGQEGSLWGIRFVYLRGDGGRVIELGDLPEKVRAGRERGIDEALQWDGRDPIRHLPRS